MTKTTAFLFFLLAAVLLFFTEEHDLRQLATYLAAPKDAQETAALNNLLSSTLLHTLRFSIAAGLAATGLVLFFFGAYFMAWLRSSWNDGKAYVLALKQSLDKHTAVLLGLVLIVAVFLSFYLPVHHDEAYSYLYYAGKGPLVAAALYNSTNNHLLFNVLASVPAAVFPDPVTGMRLVCVVAGLLLLVHTNHFLQTVFDTKAARTATALVAVSYPFLYYVCHARGYMLAALLGAWAFTGLYSYATGLSNRLRWFVMASIFGAYTMPVFVYFFAPLVFVALVLTQGARRKHLLQAVVWVGVGVLILYMPVFLLNGWDAVHHNEQVVQLETDVASLTYPQYLFKIVQYFGFPTVYPLLAIVCGILAYRETERRPLYLFALATVVVPPLVPLLQGVYPPERVFTPLLLPLCVVMAALAERWPKTTALFCLAVFFNVRLMFLNETYAKRVETLYHNEMAADIGLRVYIHDHPTLRVLLLYHNRLNGEPVQIDYSRTFSAFDTLVFSGKYDRVFSRLAVEGFSKKEFWYEK